jgi:predicted ATP-grasp superfamily ATP-dependent carboligase
MRTVLILDADQRSALAAVRSLGASGVRLIAADSGAHTLAGASRHVAATARYPDLLVSPDDFLQRLKELCTEFEVDLALAFSDATTALVSDAREELPDCVSLALPPRDSVERLANKYRLFELASELELPMPQTQFVDDLSQARSALESMSYPCVLKPFRSRIRTANGVIPAAVRIAHSSAEAFAFLENDPGFRGHPFLLQEFVEGEGQGIFALYDRGEPRAFFAHRRLREKPPEGGVSVLSESIEVNPRMRAIAEKLLSGADWHGVAMVEFKVSPDGTPYLMEINTRFWGSLQLSVDAGVDFPKILYQIAFGQAVDSPGNYQTGIRLRWLLGDLDRLYLVLRGDRNRWPLRRKLYEVLRFLIPHPLRTRHEVDRFGDMGPFWYELRRWFADVRASRSR